MANGGVKMDELTEVFNVGENDNVWVDQMENGLRKSKKFGILRLLNKLKTIFGESLIGSGDIDAPKDGKTYGRKMGNWTVVSESSVLFDVGYYFKNEFVIETVASQDYVINDIDNKRDNITEIIIKVNDDYYNIGDRINKYDKVTIQVSGYGFIILNNSLIN